MNYEELETAYQEASRGQEEPDLIVGPWELILQYCTPEEVAAVEEFRKNNPGKNWSLDRETGIVTEEEWEE